MSTFITKLDAAGTGPRLAVKDLIDVAGVPTTAGCRAVERTATAATSDAACLAGARTADARIVGKTNLHELAMLPLGTNPWFGTPVNPLDPARVPGGSSSGSAVVVATDDADIALGSDTGGSVRVPAACCGIVGLKTTHGRVSLDGVWPLAPSLDTVGPMAATVAGVAAGMALLEPGFTPSGSPAHRIGRVPTSGRPEIEAAVDAALRAAGFDVVTVAADVLEAGASLFASIYFDEIWTVDHQLVADHPDGVGDDITAMMGMAEAFRGPIDRPALEAWRRSLLDLFDDVELLALPTLPTFAPRLDELSPDSLVPTILELTSHVAPFNPAGVPALAQPVPVAGALPASLQLVGSPGDEELLVATAAVVESALG